MWVQSLVREIPCSRKWYPKQYYCLENPIDRGAWQATWGLSFFLSQIIFHFLVFSLSFFSILRLYIFSKYSVSYILYILICSIFIILKSKDNQKFLTLKLRNELNNRITKEIDNYIQSRNPNLKCARFHSVKRYAGNSLAVQWLGLCTFNAKGVGSIPAWETKILQASGCSQSKIKQEMYLCGRKYYCPLIPHSPLFPGTRQGCTSPIWS